MKKKIVVSLTVCGAVLLLGFQNCMQTRPAAPDTAALEAQSILSAADGPCRNWYENVQDMTPLDSGRELTGDVSGYYAISELASIHDATGSVAVIAKPGQRAHIGSIKNFTGTLYICDADVDRLENVSVNRATFVGGSLGSVIGVKGQIVMKGGAVTGEVSSPGAQIIN